MKTPHLLLATALVVLLSTLNAQLSTVFAQGGLTPPGAPAPLFKTLQQVEPRTPISALPFTISNSGSFYVTSNLTGIASANGITVQADDVTLDLSGFTLAGVASSLDGIHVTGLHTNVAIRNGTVRGWGGDGIDASSLFSGSFLELRAIGNVGNGFNAGTNALLNLCIADYNQANGIVASRAAMIQNCTARENGAAGFFVLPPGGGAFPPAGAQLINCFAHTNGGNGFTVTVSQVINCYSANNLGHGIFCSTRSQVTGCKVMLNHLSGIFATSGSSIIGNSVVGVGATLGSTNACILSIGGSGNRFEDNHLMNHDTGMLVTGGNNFIFKNTSQGITLASNYVITAGGSIGPTNTASGVVTNHPWANFIE
ncbi:MAG: right-handed parallel beta-helix repeat-containing protein [Verrucomicrobia bacterium]|nr:right-handed parallel beta-helix repeat-containing protein [Verrucomicrobiota bacterium]